MEISLSELLSVAGTNAGHPCPFEVGKCYIIRCVTHYCVGRVKSVVGNFVVLSEASWVQDTGRWHDALRTGDMNEIEPFIDDAIVGLGAIVDATAWNHRLPAEQK